jgi:hypothetical protein
VPLHENVLPVVERMLDKECLLSSFCSLVLGPGQEAQPIHEDTQLIPLPRPHIPITINAIWALSDFRQDNGATRILPGIKPRNTTSNRFWGYMPSLSTMLAWRWACTHPLSVAKICTVLRPPCASRQKTPLWAKLCSKA